MISLTDLSLSKANHVQSVPIHFEAPAVPDLPAKRRRAAPRRPGFTMHDRRLVDILPETAPILPVRIPEQATSLATTEPDPPDPLHSHHQPSSLHGRLDTPKNKFGVFRRYHAAAFPSHDPESLVDLERLSNIPKPPPVPHPTTSDNDLSAFYPYTNKSAFLLGDWYWNHGVQKSQDSFKRLLEIVGSPTFSPADVNETNWDSVNKQLATNEWDEGEWVDEDAGWQRSSVTIQVPFPRSTRQPGPQSFTITDFYHRSITSIIREKLSNPDQAQHFHYEPFELLWQSDNQQDPVHLHGELYSSPAFLKAHQDLQSSPGEPGCKLPRVVVSLMFWSDATHLTNFGKTKLWPLYLFFGNDSKYRRCMPSENLCEHVAYFEAVGYALFFLP